MRCLCGALILAGASALSPYKHFTIDLDLPPRKRWKHVVRHYKDHVKRSADQSQQLFKQYDPDQLEELYQATKLREDYLEELKGIVAELDVDWVDLKFMVLRQMKYELGVTQSFGCTGVVMALQNGTVLQGRNLDLGGSRQPVVDSLLDLTFIKNGKPLIRGIGHVGLIGLHNGYRVGGWSYQQNTRYDFTMHRRDLWLKSSVTKAKNGGGIFLFEARAALEELATYKEALDRLRSTKLMTPMFHVIAGSGPYEGAVITVDVGPTYEPSTYKYRELSMMNWYLVQTNDDWGYPPLDLRRTTASNFIDWNRHELNHLPAKKGSTPLEKVMRIYPVCNDYTIYTWYMSAATGMDYVEPEACSPKTGSFRKQRFGDRTVMPDSELEGDLPDVTPLFAKMSDYVF